MVSMACPTVGEVVDQRWQFLRDDEAIRRAVGPAIFRRGAEYVLEGRVETFTASSGGVLLATVRGAGQRRYEVLVTSRDSASRGQCSCPVGHNCKHLAAVLVEAQRRLTADGGLRTGPAGRGDAAATDEAATDEAARRDAAARPRDAVDRWEGWVTSLARTGQAAAGTTATTGASAFGPTAFALEFEVVTDPARLGLTGRPRVRIRPLALGRSGRWVHAGAAWENLTELADLAVRVPSMLSDQGQALARMYRTRPSADSAGKPGSRWSTGWSRSSVAAEPSVYLDDFDRGLWSHLRDRAALDLPFVGVDGAAGTVDLCQPATLSLDLTRDPADRSIRLRAVVTVAGAQLAPASVHLLGEPAHGLFCWPARLDPASPHPASPGPTAADGTRTDRLLLAPFDRPAPAQLTDLLQTDGSIVVPAADVDRFLASYYRRLHRAVRLCSSDGSVDLPDVAPPMLALTATFEDDHAVTLDWQFAYRTGDRVDRVPLDGTLRPVDETDEFRDRAAESDLLRRLALPTDPLPQLGSRTRPNPHVRLSGLDTATFVEQVLPQLRADDNVLVQVNGEPARYRRSESAPQIELTTDDAADESDWFDLGVTVSLDGEQVPFEQLFTALAHDEHELLLESGTYFSIDRPELAQLRALIDEAHALSDRPWGDRPRLSIYQAGIWDELRTLGVVARQSERWRTAVGGLLDIDDSAPPAVPDSLDATLRPYQRDGYRWLRFLSDHRLGGILADDMGLGKTVQVLALMCAAVERDPASPPFLVVAPTSVVANWAHETARFAPGLSVVTVEQTQTRRRTPLAAHIAGAHVVVTSYALFRLEFDDYAALEWSGLILDEAQFVKNHQGKTYQCARRLTAPFKVAVTGTPLENNVMELWALLSVVAPGLFPDPNRFAETFAKPLEAGKTPDLLATFRRRISPLIRRRTKEQVIDDLPAKQEQVVEVTLSPRHQRIYQTHLQRERQKVLGLIDDMDSNRFSIFRSLTLLRQLCLDPALVDRDYAGVGSRKVDALLERLEEAVSEGHRALVFNQFTGFLQVVRARLDERGLAYCYLDGRTRDRPSVIAAFKAGHAPVFLISLKAGGFGLNLTEADYCFVLDPWWNPAVEAQAVDRTHRIGQRATVMVYRLVSADTIEEKVMALQARKRDLFARVVDESGQFAAGLSANDIRELLDSTR
jgi:superfamily II DNA or RNA helicase